MAGSKSRPAGNCTNCSTQGFKNSKLVAIYFVGNHGEEELMEIHCSTCGFNTNSEGKITDAGRTFEGNKRERK